MLEHIVYLFLVPLGLVCLFRPFLILYLFTTLMVLQFAPTADFNNMPLLKFGSINIFANDYLTIILFVLIFSIFVKNVINKRKLLYGLVEGQINKLVITLFLWSVFVGFLSYSKGFEIQNVLRELASEALMFLAVFIPTIPGAEEKKERFFKYSIFLGLLLVGFALWKYFISHDVELTSSGTVRTLLGNSVVVLILPICYLLFYSRNLREHKLLSSSLIVLLTVGIILTGHRSGLIDLAFVFFMYFLTSDFNLRKYLWGPTAAAAAFLLVVLIAPSLNLTPGKSMLGDMVLRAGDTFNLQNSTTDERLSKWDFALQIAEEHPLLGLGRFPVHTDSVVGVSDSNLKYSFADFNKATHNMFAEQLANTGFLGVFVLAGFIFFLFRQLSTKDDPDRRYMDFLKAYVFAFLVFCQFNTSFSDPTGKVFLFIMVGFLNVRKLTTAAPQPEVISSNSEFSGEGGYGQTIQAHEIT